MKNIFDTYKTFAIVGKPGSGKGTQSELLGKETGFEPFSSGQRFRELAGKEDVLGDKISRVMNKGELMPYWFASFVFEEKALYTPDDQGIIFDGVARKAPEAVLFHDVMQWLLRPYLAICLNISDESVVARTTARREVQHRADDSEEAVKIRIKQYWEEAHPAIEVFRDKKTLIDVNGDQSKEDVFAEILQKLGTLAEE